MIVLFIKYLYQENAGQAAARNAGLKYATGQLIASLDSDDFWLPDFLQKMVSALEERKLDFVFANWFQAGKYNVTRWKDFMITDPFLQPYIDRGKDRSGWFYLDSADLRELYLKACPSPSSSLLMRRSSIVSGWNTRLNIGDDWGIYLDTIFSKSCKAAFTLDKLWYKDVDDLNIYDGRERSEIVKLLLIEDTKEMIDRYRENLTTDELQVLEKKYVAGLMELAKHTLVRERRPLASFHLFKEAFALQPVFSLVEMRRLLYLAVDNHVMKRIS